MSEELPGFIPRILRANDVSLPRADETLYDNVTDNPQHYVAGGVREAAIWKGASRRVVTNCSTEPPTAVPRSTTYQSIPPGRRLLPTNPIGWPEADSDGIKRHCDETAWEVFRSRIRFPR
jgi:hypothetical protein